MSQVLGGRSGNRGECAGCCRFPWKLFKDNRLINEGYLLSMKELNLSEIAYLCSIPNSPSYYDPIKHPENAISRRDKILNDMYECGYITNKELKEALDYEVVLNPSVTEKIQNYETTYAIDCAVKYLMKLNGFEFKYKFADTAEYNTYMDSYNEAWQT